ncbi:hypothetical protein [Shimia haliotis]|uniref:hypothetical protein n=1 Tax=Shimia haliotis TaxID=1280847 RepID=UPI0011142351|nr:hypothetical protein [Shimia haliotis]
MSRTSHHNDCPPKSHSPISCRQEISKVPAAKEWQKTVSVTAVLGADYFDQNDGWLAGLCVPQLAGGKLV